MLALLPFLLSLTFQAKPNEQSAWDKAWARPMIGHESKNKATYRAELKDLGFELSGPYFSSTGAVGTWTRTKSVANFRDLRSVLEGQGYTIWYQAAFVVEDPRNRAARWAKGQCGCVRKCKQGREAPSCRPRWWGPRIASIRGLTSASKQIRWWSGLRLSEAHGHRAGLHAKGGDEGYASEPILKVWSKEPIDEKAIVAALRNAGAKKVTRVVVSVTISTKLSTKKAKTALDAWGFPDLVDVKKRGRRIVVRFRWGTATPGSVMAAIHVQDQRAKIRSVDGPGSP